MTTTPRWFRPVAVLALVWNLLGCAAYLADAMITPEQLSQLPEARRALYEARPAWAMAGTAVAVWFGAAGGGPRLAVVAGPVCAEARKRRDAA